MFGAGTTRGRVRMAVGIAALIGILGSSVALGAGEGDPLLGGVRNPSPDTSQELRSETEIIAENGTYGTRQSNKGSGGGAIYGCRSARDAEPCVRANNLRDGHAFEFETEGHVAGSIQVGDDSAQPFSTNGRGRVENLHADRVDASDLAPVFGQLAPGAAATLVRLGALRLAVRCDANANPTVSANTTATTAVIQSIAHHTGGGDNRTADAGFARGETHVTGFTASSSGTIIYMDGRGAVSVQLMTQRVANACWIGGSAQGGPNLG